MRGKTTRGYVLKVAVASASLATLAACESAHPVGTVASPPTAPMDATDAGVATSPSPDAVGSVARTPASPVDAGPPAPSASVAAPKPKPPAHKVGTIAHPPDFSPTVGTTANAPDSNR